MQAKRRVHVIVNPASGKDQPVLSVLNRVFGSELEWDISITKEAGDARRQAADAVQRGVDVVVACGGDGTVMEVANGLVGSGVPLAVLPAGTANVLAVELGIPRNLEQAAKLLTDAETVQRSIDVGEVDGSFFLLRLGIGFEAVMIANADREFKQRFGTLSYPISAIQSALTTDSVADYRITIDGETHEAKGVSCMVANSGKIGLGDLTVNPAMAVADGLLDVALLRAPGQEEETVADPPEQDTRPDPLLLHWQGHEITVEADPPQPIIFDGDPRGETPITIVVRPQALTVLVPAVAAEAAVEENGTSVAAVLTPLPRFWNWRRPGHMLLDLVERIVRFVRGAPIRRFSEITPGLMIGGQHSRRGIKRMQERGIKATLNLRSESDDSKRDRAMGQYLHLPVTDGMEPSQQQLREGVAFIKEQIDSGGTVYVHCKLGVGRAPTLAAAYLMSTGMTADQAWDRIRAVRPFVRPSKRQLDALQTFIETK